MKLKSYVNLLLSYYPSYGQVQELNLASKNNILDIASFSGTEFFPIINKDIDKGYFSLGSVAGIDLNTFEGEGVHSPLFESESILTCSIFQLPSSTIYFTPFTKIFKNSLLLGSYGLGGGHFFNYLQYPNLIVNFPKTPCYALSRFWFFIIFKNFLKISEYFDYEFNYQCKDFLEKEAEIEYWLNTSDFTNFEENLPRNLYINNVSLNDLKIRRKEFDFKFDNNYYIVPERFYYEGPHNFLFQSYIKNKGSPVFKSYIENSESFIQDGVENNGYFINFLDSMFKNNKIDFIFNFDLNPKPRIYDDNAYLDKLDSYCVLLDEATSLKYDFAQYQYLKNDLFRISYLFSVFKDEAHYSIRNASTKLLLGVDDIVVFWDFKNYISGNPYHYTRFLVDDKVAFSLSDIVSAPNFEKPSRLSTFYYKNIFGEYY